MLKFKTIALTAVFMLFMHGLYAQYVGQVNMNPADVTTSQTDGYDHVTISGCFMETDVGRPWLPVKHLHVAIPEDKTVAAIEILSFLQQELTGTYNIMPTQAEQIPGQPVPDFVSPDPDIYNVNTKYPAEYLYSPTSGFMSGVHLAGLLYYPLQYNPVTHKLYLTTHLEYRLVYADQENSPVKPRRMTISSYLKTKENLESMAVNSSDVSNYFQLEKTDIFSGAAFLPNEFPDFNGQAVEYVVITNQTLAEGFQEIANWKTRKGVPAVVRTVEWIYNNYPGADRAEKVRNFIIDAYQNWGTQFFMLGGDSDVAPIRYAWISHWNRADLKPEIPNGDLIAADMYFACLDGNWNADGDATFGEANWNRQNDGTFVNTNDPYANIDNVDRLPDVVIGRVPVEDYLDNQNEPVELNRFKAKFFEYVKTSQGNENNVLFFSQDSDGIYHSDMDTYVAPQFPASVNITKLYQVNGDNNMDVLNALNATDNIKKHIICGFGHGGPNNFNACNGPLDRTVMDNLINPDRSEIFYLNSCKTMGWQYNTVTEHYINSENGGVSVIGYSTFGWTNGPREYNKPFIYNLYHDDNHIGITFNKVKILKNSNSYKDCIERMDFFSLSLASDPEMPVWTDSPDLQNPLIVNVPASVYTGQQAIAIEINNLESGVEGIVCLYKAGEVYAREPLTGTGSTINVTLNCTPDTQGEILVTVTAKNYLPVETSISVTNNPGRHLYISDHTISGDENIDAGESVDLNVELSNSGLTTASNVYAVLSSTETYITVNNANSTFGNINAGAEKWGQSEFGFTISPLITENKVALFALEIHDGNGNIFNDELRLEIKAPIIEQRNKTIVSTSNGNNIIEAGETVSFNIGLFNNSQSMLQNVNAALSSQSAYVTGIQQIQGAYGNIASYETNTSSNTYVFTVSNTYPGEPEPILFSLDVSNEFGQQWQFTFDLLEKPDISDIVIDFRGYLTSIALFWTVYDNVLGYNIYRSNTVDGEYIKQNTQILPMAYFEDIGLPELTEFYYKVSAVSLSGNESKLSQPKQAWTSLAYHPDWLPLTVSDEDHGYFWGAPNVYDLENDGEKEIFIASGTGDQANDKGTIFAFRHDGEELYDIDNNPTTVSGFANISISMTCAPAIGDIDNDGIAEIIVATRMGNPDDATKHKLFVYKNTDADDDKKPDLMWEKQIAYKNFNGVVLSDLNDDGTLEIIVPNQWGNTIEVFDYLGNNFPGWPKTTGENPIDKKAVSMPVVVDLDNDGDKEIVIGLEGGIYIWNSDGTNYLSQNPINLNIPSGGRLDCPVIAADIDNDGFFEILFMSIRNTTGYIYAFEANGDLISGWANDNHSIELSISSQTWAWPPAFVCGDIDLDGTLEVAVADADMLKVWNNLGELILEKSIPLLECQYLQPLIADIDSDASDCEIIIPSNNGVIHAYKLNGNSVLGWPLYFGSTTSIPLIADIDNDSKNEIIAASGSDIFVWDTEGSGDIQWGRARLNSHNNGVVQNPCAYNPIPLTVNEDQTWTSDFILDRDLYVEDAILTIKSKISFPTQAKVVVKPGAKLVIDEGSFTNSCNGYWQGIEVWGNKLHSQSPDQNGVVYQGTLELKNGAIIENAITAVALWNPGDYNSTGGIVIANDAIFRNNTRSVHALMYSNFNQYFPELLLPNRSYFKNCTFELTEDYHGDETFYKHVDLFDVFGVDFKACNFSLDPNAPNIGTFNHGIAAYSAGFNLLTVCSNTSVMPCPSYVGNTFNGFNRAVSSTNALLSSPSFFVTGADFSNNAYGIHVNDVGNFTVINSNFNVGIENYNGGCKIGPGVGIYTNFSTGFAIQENSFTKFTSAPPGTYYGTWINNTHQADEVYKNNFTGLKYANYSEGKNWWREDRFTGLAYYCNENQNNYADFYVGRDASNEGGIQSKQGDLSHDAGNTFTQSGATWHFYNDGNHLIEYYHNNGQANKIPDINLLYQVMPYGINYNNSCPSYYGGGASDNPMAMSAAEQQQAEQLFIANLNDYNNVKTLYSSLIDGGNTGGTLFDIQTAHPDDMWALRAQLLGKSPHLSIGVLKEASDRTDMFNDAALFDILAANPDELKKAELINYLEQKAEPLPDYMVNILKQVAEGTTYKTVLEQQMAHYNRNKTRAAHNMIRHIAHDSIVDNNLLRQWLNNLGGIQSDKQIIGTFVHEGNYANALTLANMLPQLYNLQNDELIAHNDYLEMLNLQHTLHQQNRNLFQLSGAEKQQLDALATGVGTAALQARAILEMVYHEYTEPCPCMDETGSLKNADINLSNPAKESLLSVTAKPNPARDWVVFEYSLPGETREATIRISDAGGRIVETMSVSGKQGQKMWDTRGLVSGTYYYVLINAGEYKSGRIVLHK